MVVSLDVPAVIRQRRDQRHDVGERSRIGRLESFELSGERLMEQNGHHATSITLMA